MKNQYLKIFIFIAFLGFSNAKAQNIAKQNGSSLTNGTTKVYHYSPDGKIFYDLSNQKVLIKFKSTISVETQKNLLSAEKLLEPITKEMFLPSPKVVMAELTKGVSDDQILALIEKLNKNEQIEYANPFLVYQDGTSEAALDRFIVKLKNNTDYSKMEKLVKQNGAYIDEQYKYDPNLYFIKITKSSTMRALEMANQFVETGLFAASEPDVLKLLKKYNTNDTFLPYQWSLNNTGSSIQYNGTSGADMKIFAAWGITTGSAAIKIAIIDEGVDLVHPDLLANLLPGFDGTGLGSNGGPSGNDAHGTACAGIVAGVGNNNLGVAGIAYNSKIIPVRIAYSSGGNWVTSNSVIGTSLDWAWNQGGADVLSNSWGGGGPSVLINDPITRANTQGRGGKGAPVLFAAGNSNGANSYPATLTNVISVVAMSMCNQRKSPTSCDGENFWGSNFGTGVDIAAPGVKIYTTDISGSAGYSAGDYAPTFNGTSSACPNAAGVMALILSTNPNLTVSQARQIIESTADKVGGYTYNSGVSGQVNGTWSTDLGHGRVNAFSAVQLANPVPCTAPPAVAAVSVIPSTLCITGNVSVSLTGIGMGTGQTYQWQSSLNNSIFANISGATNQSITVSNVSATTYYRCIVTCSGLSTTSISSQVTYQNATISTFPSTQNFDGSTSLPCGWSVQDVNADGNTWALGTLTPRSVTNNVAYSYNATNAANDYLFSPPLALNATKSYRVRFWYRVRSATYPENIEVRFGNAANATAMTSATIFTVANAVNTTYVEAVSSVLVPPSSGSYTIGFKATSLADKYDIYIDDVTFEEVSACTTPAVGGTASGVSTFQSGSSGVFNLSGQIGSSIQWQSSSNAGTSYSDIVGATGATATIALIKGTYLIRTKVTNPNCTDAFSNALSLNVTTKVGDNLLLPFITSLPFAGVVSTIASNGYTNDYTGAQNQTSADVFYRFRTSECADSILVSSCGSPFDTYIHLLDSNGVRIGGNDDNGVLCTGTAGSIKVLANPNTLYYAVFEGYGDATGNISVALSEIQKFKTYYADQDGDGFGNIAITQSACTRPLNYVLNSTDCNDNNAAINTAVSYFVDADNDGFGSTTTALLCSSSAPLGYSTNSTDCNDSNSNVNPNALEVCGNNIDDDCDGQTDENCVTVRYYQDLDIDNFGNSLVFIDLNSTLSVPNGYILNNADCNDNNFLINPSAIEICNGIDDNCDGIVDNGTFSLATASAINGPSGVCRNLTGIIFTVDAIPGATSYIWTLPTGASGVSSTNSITLSFSNAYNGGVICVKAVNSCIIGSSYCRTISYFSVKPNTPSTISGVSAGACVGQTRVFFINQVNGATSYIWTAPLNSTIMSGQGTTSIVLRFDAGFTTGNLLVSASNCIGVSSNRVLTLHNYTIVPTTINGLGVGLCSGSNQTFSCTTVPGAESYLWTIPVGTTLNSGQGTNSISLSANAGFIIGNLTVRAVTACFTSTPRTRVLQSLPTAPTSIVGSIAEVCGGSTQTYSCPISTTGATSYNWTLPAGFNFISGQGTTVISVSIPIGFVSGNVSVSAANGCGSSSLRSITVVSGTATPGAIIGQISNLCGGGIFNYSIPPVIGALSYNWSIPAGCSIISNTGTSISLNVPVNFTGGVLSVVATNSCGSSLPRNANMTRLPATPAVISGPTSVCQNATNVNFSVVPLSGFNYNWIVPAGVTINSGQGTSSINVNWNSTQGTIYARAQNTCGGSQYRLFNVAVNLCRIDEQPVKLEPSVSVYPNPSSGNYTISLKGIEEGDHLVVSDLLGKQILTKPLNTNADLMNLDLTNMPAGAYIIKFTGNNLNENIKIIKQ